MTPTRMLIESLATSCPSAEDIKDLAYALHDAQVRANAPELLWMKKNFEDMGDYVSKAIWMSAPSEPDDSWIERQDKSLEERYGK